MARSPIKRRSQRNKTTERAVSVGVGVDREEGLGLGGWTKFEKGGLGNVGGGLHKIRGLGPLCRHC